MCFKSAVPPQSTIPSGETAHSTSDSGSEEHTEHAGGVSLLDSVDGSAPANGSQPLRPSAVPSLGSNLTFGSSVQHQHRSVGSSLAQSARVSALSTVESSATPETPCRPAKTQDASSSDLASVHQDPLSFSAALSQLNLEFRERRGGESRPASVAPSTVLTAAPPPEIPQAKLKDSNMFRTRYWSPRSSKWDSENFLNPLISRYECPHPGCT